MKKLILPWQGINIKITYEPDYSQAVKTIQGYQLAHIQIQADTPLPITKTGYKSAFMPDSEVQEAGGVIKLIMLNWIKLPNPKNGNNTRQNRAS